MFTFLPLDYVSLLNQGPEVEIVETATIGDNVYIFIGSQRVSTIMTYMLAPGSNIPQFQGLHRAGGLGHKWGDLFEQRDIGDCDTQDMKWVLDYLGIVLCCRVNLGLGFLWHHTA